MGESKPVELTPSAVRKRPGMFFGDVHDGSGLQNLLMDLVSNSLDGYFVGDVSLIDVSLLADGSIRVHDDGLGISIEPDADGRTFLERVLTEFHHTPTADGHSPHLHLSVGAGLAPICAVAAKLRVEIQNPGGHFVQTFSRGTRTSALVREGDSKGRGTTVEVSPDTDIFLQLRWDPTEIDRRLQELAFLCPGLQTSFHCERRVYGPTADLSQLVRRIAIGSPLHDNVILCAADDGLMKARVGLLWCDPSRFYPQAKVETFCNLHRTGDGGSHLRGFKRGLCAALGTTPKDYEALAAGLFAVVSVTLIDPEYGSPTKDELVTPAARTLVASALSKGLPPLLEGTPELQRMLHSRRA